MQFEVSRHEPVANCRSGPESGQLVMSQLVPGHPCSITPLMRGGGQLVPGHPCSFTPLVRGSAAPGAPLLHYTPGEAGQLVLGHLCSFTPLVRRGKLVLGHPCSITPLMRGSAGPGAPLLHYTPDEGRGSAGPGASLLHNTATRLETVSDSPASPPGVDDIDQFYRYHYTVKKQNRPLCF